MVRQSPLVYFLDLNVSMDRHLSSGRRSDDPTTVHLDHLSVLKVVVGHHWSTGVSSQYLLPRPLVLRVWVFRPYSPSGSQWSPPSQPLGFEVGMNRRSSTTGTGWETVSLQFLSIHFVFRISSRYQSLTLCFYKFKVYF